MEMDSNKTNAKTNINRNQLNNFEEKKKMCQYRKICEDSKNGLAFFESNILLRNKNL